MTAFVAGATGLTGREVVRQLCERGVSTIAHVRPDSSSRERWTTRFQELGATVSIAAWTADAMEEALADATLVYALLGTTRKRGKAAKREGKNETYETIDYGLSKLLLDAAQGGRPRFVYLSSMGVSATTTNAYLAVRHRLETDLQQSGLPWAVARPSFIDGDRDETRPGEAVGIVVADGALALVGALGGRRLRERYRSQTNVELARALVEIGLRDDLVDQIHESDRLRELAAA
ncbi:MAG: NAD(P)H-binding protein [Myxococcota bacterium]